MIIRSSSTLEPASRIPYICLTCSHRLCSPNSISQRRTISQNYLKKTLEAKIAWAKQAKVIKDGNKESMLSMLESRGYVNQIVGDRDELDRLMTEKRIGIYAGFDPTAPSLHVGHLLPLMVLFWSYIKGFHSASVLGGATAQIGDPIGRTEARKVERSDTRKINMTKIHYQLKLMWTHAETKGRDFGYEWEWPWRRELTNNNAWMNKLNAIDLLKLLGRGVRLGTMLGRDTVKNRMKQGGGMSFAEFSYPLLQSYDWWHMYSTKDVQVQIGGSDQFGNILAGIDAINYIRHNHHNPDERVDESKLSPKEALLTKPMGFTVPLLTTASGEKFGKSAGNAIWLDRDMTSAFELYQFFLGMADADVHRYLKLFTFETLENLDKLMEEHSKEPSKRVAQHKLAHEVLGFVHGKKVALEAEQEHRSMFKKPSIQVTKPQGTEGNGKQRPEDINVRTNKNATAITAENAPSLGLTLPESLVLNQPITKVLYHAGLVASRSEGHRLCVKGGAYIGSRPDSVGAMSDQVDFTPAANWQGEWTQRYIIGGDTLIIRIGKWKVKIIKIISDADFDAQGLTAPGWEEYKQGVKDQPLEADVQAMRPWYGPKKAERLGVDKKLPEDISTEDTRSEGRWSMKPRRKY